MNDPKLDHPSLDAYRKQQEERAAQVFGHLKRQSARARLANLADALVADIMALSDEEVLAEFIEDHGDPEKHEAEMRALVEKSITEAEKRFRHQEDEELRRLGAPEIKRGPLP